MNNTVKTTIGKRALIVSMAVAFLGLPGMANAASDTQDILQRANTVLQDANSDPQFGMAPDLFRRARAVMVIPQLVKGGLMVGAEGGNGVLLQRTASNTWGDPLFYTMGGVSFGAQIGVEVAEAVLFVMSEKALHAWTNNDITLGTKAGLTVLVVGSNVEAAATTNANVDVIAWAKAKGAYAGITLEGSVIKPRHEWNTAYYGHPVTVNQVLKLSGR